MVMVKVKSLLVYRFFSTAVHRMFQSDRGHITNPTAGRDPKDEAEENHTQDLLVAPYCQLDRFLWTVHWSHLPI